MNELTQDQIRDRIVKLQNLVMHARNDERDKTVIPLEEFTEEIRLICDNALRLPHEQALEIQPMLMKLRDNLVELTQEMTSQQAQKTNSA